MRRTIKQLAFIAVVLAVALAQPSGSLAMNLSRRSVATVPARGAAVAAAADSSPANAATTFDQSGYWAQVSARDATVRNRAGGSVVLLTLTRGQYFHVYNVDRRSPAWFVGYACPHGNRGCGSGQSIPGYILRSTLSGRGSALGVNPAASAGDFLLAASSTEESPQDEAGLQSAPLLKTVAAGGASLLALSGERRVCAKDVYLRDNKLHPIAIMRRGDRFRVEKYTDGSENDGRARWAIGTGPGNVHGRVLVSALCP
jgi:hypothetical protein